MQAGELRRQDVRPLAHLLLAALSEARPVDCPRGAPRAGQGRVEPAMLAPSTACGPDQALSWVGWAGQFVAQNAQWRAPMAVGGLGRPARAAGSRTPRQTR